MTRNRSLETVPVTADDVIAQRLHTQRLTAKPLSAPDDVVRLLTCVQSQDAPLARFSVGMRCGATDTEVLAALAAGRIVRTHILRPTWHFVAPDDLCWILALTSGKVESGLAARHRQLGLDDAAVVDRVHGRFADLLTGRRCLTRRAIAEELRAAGAVLSNEQLGHLLMLAESRARLFRAARGRDTYVRARR